MDKNRKKKDKKLDKNSNSKVKSLDVMNLIGGEVFAGVEADSKKCDNIEENVLKLINQKLNHPLVYEDIENEANNEIYAGGTDEETECIEYVFRPRQYFLHSLCQFCKDCPENLLMPCNECQMVFYCSSDHRKKDKTLHGELCTALRNIALQRGGQIFNSAKSLSSNEYQIFRVSTITTCESMLRRQLQPFEKEIILFPRLCNNPNCRECNHNRLKDCPHCNQVSFCGEFPDHLGESHQEWCKQLKLFQKIISHQGKYGKISPALPTKVLRTLLRASSISNVFANLYDRLADIANVLFYAELTQIASPALTTWLSLRTAELTEKSMLVIHVIGAEQQFEIDNLQKWEMFLLHLIPRLQKLTLVFVGPELNLPEVQLLISGKEKLCKSCQKEGRQIRYRFENALYHEYARKPSFESPDLVCYFDPGLYRETGFNDTNTWPETVKVSVNAKCPVLVTSYTQYESQLDLKTYLRLSSRPIDIILPATVNPFRSQRPERNFISEEQAPLIYKNFYLFLLK